MKDMDMFENGDLGKIEGEVRLSSLILEKVIKENKSEMEKRNSLKIVEKELLEVVQKVFSALKEKPANFEKAEELINKSLNKVGLPQITLEYKTDIILKVSTDDIILQQVISYINTKLFNIKSICEIIKSNKIDTKVIEIFSYDEDKVYNAFELLFYKNFYAEYIKSLAVSSTREDNVSIEITYIFNSGKLNVSQIAVLYNYLDEDTKIELKKRENIKDLLLMEKI